MKVTIYSTPTCPYCKLVKEFLVKNKIAFTDYDVSADTAKAQEMIDRSGQMGVPVIVVGDEIIVGFDEKKLTKALGL